MDWCGGAVAQLGSEKSSVRDRGPPGIRARPAGEREASESQGPALLGARRTQQQDVAAQSRDGCFTLGGTFASPGSAGRHPANAALAPGHATPASESLKPHPRTQPGYLKRAIPSPARGRPNRRPPLRRDSTPCKRALNLLTSEPIWLKSGLRQQPPARALAEPRHGYGHHEVATLLPTRFLRS